MAGLRFSTFLLSLNHNLFYYKPTQDRLTESEGAVERVREEMQLEVAYLMEDARKEVANSEVESIMIKVTEAEMECASLRASSKKKQAELEYRTKISRDLQAEVSLLQSDLRDARVFLSDEKIRLLDREAEAARRLEDDAELVKKTTQSVTDQLTPTIDQLTSQVQQHETSITEFEKTLKIKSDQIISLKEQVDGFQTYQKTEKEQLKVMKAQQLSLEKAYTEQLEAEAEVLAARAKHDDKQHAFRLRSNLLSTFATMLDVGRLRQYWIKLTTWRMRKTFVKQMDDLRVEIASRDVHLKTIMGKKNKELTLLQQKLIDTNTQHQEALLTATKETRSSLKSQYDSEVATLKKRISILERQVLSQPSIVAAGCKLPKGEFTKSAADKQAHETAVELHTQLKLFSTLFVKKFKMKRFNTNDITSLDESSQVPIPLQVLRSSAVVITSFKTLLAIERKLQHLKRGMVFLTVAEKIKLKRMRKKLARQQVSEQESQLVEKHVVLVEKTIDRAIEVKEAVQGAQKRLFTEATEINAATVTQELEHHTTLINELKRDMTREESKIDVQKARIMLQDIEDGKWVYVAGQRRWWPTERPQSSSKNNPAVPTITQRSNPDPWEYRNGTAMLSLSVGPANLSPKAVCSIAHGGSIAVKEPPQSNPHSRVFHTLPRYSNAILIQGITRPQTAPLKQLEKGRIPAALAAPILSPPMIVVPARQLHPGKMLKIQCLRKNPN